MDLKKYLPDDINEINGNYLVVMDNIRKYYPYLFNQSGGMDWKVFEVDIRPKYDIFVRHDKNSISFNLKKEANGKGCSVSTVLEAISLMIKRSDNLGPSNSKKEIIKKLDEVIKLIRTM